MYLNNVFVDGGDVAQQCTSVYVEGPQSTGIIGQSPHVLPSTPDMSTGIPSGVPPVAYSLSQAPGFNQTSYSLISHPQTYPEGQLSLSNSLVFFLYRNISYMYTYICHTTFST